MNRDEKNQQTRQRIINSALLEFSEKNYGDASLNTVCSVGSISKGIIYHYFKDKDQLYLLCVKECFNALTSYLSNIVTIRATPIETALNCYFEARINFFAENPSYFNLFCNVMIAPPPHLRVELADIKTKFNALNLSVISALLTNEKLRSDVTMTDVVSIFQEYQDFINTQFQAQPFNEITIKEHEERCSRSLSILLYGVIERGTTI